MDSKDWAHIEATDGLSKPWLLMQWRLNLLQEQRPTLLPEVYAVELADLHQALMKPVDGRHAITTTNTEDPVFYLDAAVAEEVDQRLERSGLAPLSRID